jgi:hypothetical protein
MIDYAGEVLVDIIIASSRVHLTSVGRRVIGRTRSDFANSSESTIWSFAVWKHSRLAAYEIA